MKIFTLFVTGLALVLGLASQTAWADPITGSGVHTLEHGGVARNFRVHLPKGYNADNPAPLVLIFHGWGGSENEFLGDKTVTSLADKRGYILVAPRGLGSGVPDNSNNSWSFSGSSTGLDGDGVKPEVPGDTNAICDDGMTSDYSYSSCREERPDGPVASNTCSWTHCQADDVDFVMALIAHLEANLSVDTENIFATGGSNGGMFTWELGQNSRSAGMFRAIAPLIGLPHRGYLDPQGKLDGGELPVLLITGTQDTTVPPGDWEDDSFTTTSNGSDRYYYTGATAITQNWAVAHGCNISGDAVPFEDGIRKTDCRTYCSEDPGWPRVLDCRARMGHTYSLSWAWPLIMNFFDAHSG